MSNPWLDWRISWSLSKGWIHIHIERRGQQKDRLFIYSMIIPWAAAGQTSPQFPPTTGHDPDTILGQWLSTHLKRTMRPTESPVPLPATPEFSLAASLGSLVIVWPCWTHTTPKINPACVWWCSCRHQLTCLDLTVGKYVWYQPYLDPRKFTLLHVSAPSIIFSSVV